MPLFKTKIVTAKFACSGLIQADTKELAILMTKEQLKFHTNNFVQASNASVQIPESNYDEVLVEASVYTDPVVRFEWDLQKASDLVPKRVAPEILAKCIDIVQAYSPNHSVTSASTFLDCELDSLDMMEIVMAVETQFSIRLTENSSWSTVRDLALLVQEAKS